jgi:hypothetical protein
MDIKISFSFECGGILIAKLLPELNPVTVQGILDMLPLEAMVYHSRWSGREINFPVKSQAPIPRENQTTQTNTGDVIYWKEWEREVGEAQEAIAVYYGPEVTRDHRGYLPVNVCARVAEAQWKEIETIGMRVWQKGIEKVRVALYEEGGAE